MPYVPHTDDDRRSMLSALGLERMDDLFRGIPPALRLERPLDVPPAKTEAEILSDLGRLAERNARMDNRPSFLGAGVYRRFIPAAVDALASRGEFNTAYTPYQAEASQGTLQAVFEFQTLIAQLTGMEIANASMYDAGTALAEAVLMAYAVRSRGTRVLVSGGVHPEYRRVLDTYLRHHPVRAETLPLRDGLTAAESIESALRAGSGDVLAVVVQNPSFFGLIEDMSGVGSAIERSAPEPNQRPFFIAVADPISLGLLEAPGSYGADVAVGDGQQLGNPPAFGGPTFGFFATRLSHVRKVPGRIIGETRDRDGRRGYVLTFQTREQHIRRERATSNICTNQGLCALRGAMYLALLGKRGLREVAETSVRKAHYACSVLTKLPGIEPAARAPFFHEVALKLPLAADEVYKALARRGIGGGLPLGRYFPDREREMLFACTEMTSLQDIHRLAGTLGEVCAPAARAEGREARAKERAEAR
jgi:glycine dehydrogenase subunit 1